MAIDTEDKRRSTQRVLPIPDGTIGLGDRVHIYLYRGLLPTAPEAPVRVPDAYPFNDLVSILGLTYSRGSYVDDNVDPKLAPENRTVEAFEENDPGDPVQLPPKIKRSGRTQADFEANKITYPHGKNFNPDLINPR